MKETKAIKRIAIKASLVIGLAVALMTGPAFAQNAPGLTPGEGDIEKIDKALGKQPYSPYADRKFPSRPLFGDTHLHTGFSLDAGLFGARLTPRDAYRFARGEQVTASSGQPVKLGRPLDCLGGIDRLLPGVTIGSRTGCIKQGFRELALGKQTDHIQGGLAAFAFWIRSYHSRPFGWATSAELPATRSVAKPMLSE